MTEKELDTIFHTAEHIYDTAWSRWYHKDTMMTFEEWFAGTACERNYNNLQAILNTYREK